MTTADLKEENPDFVDRFTGKKNINGRQFRIMDKDTGLIIHNATDYYGDELSNIWNKRKFGLNIYIFFVFDK